MVAAAQITLDNVHGGVYLMDMKNTTAHTTSDGRRIDLRPTTPSAVEMELVMVQPNGDEMAICAIRADLASAEAARIVRQCEFNLTH